MAGARLVGGRLVDVPVEDPVDLLIDNGRIAAIGPGLTGDDLAGAGLNNTDTIDLDGRYVLPGLWDNHVHFTQWTLTSRRVDVSAAGSAVEAARTMANALASRPPEPGIPLVGFGFRDGLWPDVPTATLLDSVISPVPVVLVSGDLHCCWLNSAALAAFGLVGHPTGVLREDEAFPVAAALQNVPQQVLDGWIVERAAAAAARGVVGIVDFEMADNLAIWRHRYETGFDSLRVAAGIYPQHLDAAIAAGHTTGQVIAGSGGLLTIGPFKVITDGSLNTRTAFCVDPYPGLEGQPRSHGLLTVPPDQLIPLMRAASAAGILPAVHAIGDEANRLALDAFEAVGCHGRIEHAQLLLEADVVRFAALGVAASVQPEHAMDDRDVADRFWAGRTQRAFALRSLLEAGAELLLGSDAPVAPLDPWVTASAAVGRSRDGLEPWHPEQRITTAQALAASASGRSVVSVGDVADLVVVDRDPLDSSPEELRHMTVAGTLLDGRWTHRLL
ncbi:MAG: amidohydrolase [Lacisediminihabitans sp.]